MGSEVNKPNGQHIVQNKSQAILEFMKNKKIRKIHGIGPVNEYYLKGLGIQSANDILENTDMLSICFSENSCEYFLSSALGLGALDHQFKERQSVGKSETFRPTSDELFLQPKLKQLCEEVTLELEQLGFVSINVVMSYQNENYERKDKTLNLDKYSATKDVLYNACIGYLKDYIITPAKKIRLLGVKCTSLMKIDDWKRKSLQTYFSRVREKQKEKKSQTSSHTMQKGIQTKSAKSVSKESVILSQIKSKSQFICPICSQQVACMNNLSAFNRHIDKCLKSAK